MRIIVDDREKKVEVLTTIRSISEEMEGIEVEERRVGVGDYQILSDTGELLACIERKSLEDFRRSFISKRLFVQIDELVHSGANVVCLLLEGALSPLHLDTGKPSLLAIETTLEAFREIGIRIIKTHSPEESGREIALLAYSIKRRIGKRQVGGGNSNVVSPVMKKKLAEKRKRSMLPTMYLPMWLSLFDGLSLERATIISARFDNSLRKFIEISREDEGKFMEMIRFPDRSGGKRLPTKVAENILNVVRL